ncbi:MAG: substrate-binding domain-containing protein [Nitrospirota bacterium]
MFNIKIDLAVIAQSAFKYLAYTAGVLLLLVLTIIFTGTSGLGAQKITVCGTGDSQSLLTIIAREFMKENSGVIVEIPDSIGSRGGIRSTADGDCDLGRTARPFREDELKYELGYRVFAYSPVVFAVNPKGVGVHNLSTHQIIGIYSGKIASWKEVGGKDEKLYIANREKGDSSRIILEEHLEGFKDIQSFAGKIIYTTPETADTIAEYESTIGYVPLSLALYKHLNVMSIDGISPSVENVQNGTYKYSSPFGIVWKGKPSAPANAFLEYLFSPAAQKLIIHFGAVPARGK